MQMYNETTLLDPALFDQQYMQRVAAATETPDVAEQVSPEQAMANLEEAMKEGTVGLANGPLTQREAIEAGIKRRDEERRAAVLAAQVEQGAAEAMWNCWRTGADCTYYRRAVADASVSLLPGAQERLQTQLARLRLIAIEALVQSVLALGLGIAEERLRQEAQGFVANFEQPIDAGRGSVPAGATWAFHPPSAARQDAAREQLREENLMRAAGWRGAIALPSITPKR